MKTLNLLNKCYLLKDNMNKKYRLVIPDKIDKKYISLAFNIKVDDGEILNELQEHDHNKGLYCASHGVIIPFEWLQEVKEPMTCDDHWEKYLEDGYSIVKNKSVQTNNYFCYRDGWNAAIKNYKLELKEKIQEKIKKIEPLISTSNTFDGPYKYGLEFVVKLLEKE